VLSLSLTVVYQGPPYEDPNPPEVDEKAAKGKKAAADAEPEPRMITPDPATMEKESGRQFKIELGKFQMVQIPKEGGDSPPMSDKADDSKKELAAADSAKGSKGRTESKTGKGSNPEPVVSPDGEEEE